MAAEAQRPAAAGALAASLAHDINNPLTGVIGSLALLSEKIERFGALDEGPQKLALLEKMRDLCDAARTSADEIRLIVRGLREASRADGGTIRPERTPEPSTAPTRARNRILVVDDEPDLLFTVEQTLSPEHDLTVLTSAREALARIDAGAEFDIILCDLMMPDMTGMDLHTELSRRHPSLAAKMVFITGGAFNDDARRFLDESKNLTLEKPFPIRALRELARRPIG